MRKLFSILSLVLLYVTIAFGQAAIEIPITVEDSNGNTRTLIFGLDPAATGGIDVALGEVEQPPFPPGGAYEARFINFTGQSTLGEGTLKDIRNAPSFPFTGTYSHRVRFQPEDQAAGTITVSWNLPPEIIAGSTITLLGGSPVPFVGTGSLVAPAPVEDNDRVTIVLQYSNIMPVVPMPEFAITPASLNFGPVGVGLTSPPQQVTVSNTGDVDLVIAGITSTNAAFVITPTTATIPPAGNQIFNVTFTPPALGPFTADLQFDHNAINVADPFLFPVQGVGADAGPTFAVTPTSLTFPTLIVGNSQTRILTVPHNGLFNTLEITSASVTDPVNYSITPTTATILPGANQVFTVEFAPTVAGPLLTDVVFATNATPANYTVPVTGAGFIPAALSGLVFEKDTSYVLEAAFYQEKMQLRGTVPGVKIQALQFRLLTNMAIDDETILTFQNIQKGTEVATSDWVLDYNLVRGDITANGASEDTIYVLLYNLQQDNGLPTGVDYLDLLRVNYRVADLPALVDYSKSSPGFTTSEFERANIAPWVPGNELPDPDEFVNVQDLALIQNIILTGFFPNDDPVGPCGYATLPKIEGNADATVNVYITPDGISVYLDSQVGIRGAQMEFGSVVDNVGNLVINTDLGQGYYLQVEDMLRTLMYDRLAQRYIEPGMHFMADMPFTISNYNDITLDRLVLVDINVQRVMNIEVNIIHQAPPLPLDYILFQNYPNPFNPSTSVKFQVPKTSDVTIKIYDMLGQEVRTLFSGEVLRGTYTTEWDGLSNAGVRMSSGTYIYRMTAGEFVQSKKMVYVK
ncbi:MAG: choice-of-anchor D domain-containing protein [bacterium]|nr:choice-of-anchor D domain-containing protein [bacterium]